MNKTLSLVATDNDSRIRQMTIVAVYSPLALMIAAALLVF